MNNRIIDWTAAVAFVLVLGISSLWGGYVRMNDTGVKEEGVETQAAKETLEELERGPVLREEERDVLEEIASSMKERDLREAARIMNRQEEILVSLFYETMDSQRYLYDGMELKGEIEGEGMVLTKAGTVFYGSFQDGMPHGTCLALQMVELDAPRYDFADGIWQNGRMEGEGHTGYCYYENVPPGEAGDVCRKGEFSGDLMEGEITYITTNDKNEDSTWKFTVKDGKVEIDESWNYLEKSGEYQLMSLEDDSHAYVMGEEQMGLAVWANQLRWEE